MTRAAQTAVLVVLVALFALFYQGLWGDPRRIPTVLVGTHAPPFDGPDVETGAQISSQRFAGKVILVNFWASWCRECKLEHENLLKLSDAFGDHPDFAMLGINYQDEADDARTYLKERGAGFAHMRDVTGKLAIAFGVYGVPETFVIDRAGVIRHKQIGPVTGDAYANLADNVLAPLLRDADPVT